MNAPLFHVERDSLRRVEIRCCCNPAKLYGTLPLNREPRVGATFRFAVPPTRIPGPVPGDVGTVVPGGEVLLEVAVMTLGSFCSLERIGATPLPEELQRETYPALKYHGDELAFADKVRNLLHVPGFEPSAEARAVLGVQPAVGMVWP